MSDWLAAELVLYVVRPTLGGRWPYDSVEAATMLTAIALYESGAHRRFQANGLRLLPKLARGLWQFEPAGVEAISGHDGALAVLEDLKPGLGERVRRDPRGTWRRLAWDDLLACRVARALLWTVPDPLPPATDDGIGEAARQYRWAWRPGQWRPRRWRVCWSRAVSTVPELWR